jgi:hypothetical protein
VDLATDVVPEQERDGLVIRGMYAERLVAACHDLARTAEATTWGDGRRARQIFAKAAALTIRSDDLEQSEYDVHLGPYNNVPLRRELADLAWAIEADLQRFATRIRRRLALPF